MRLLCYRGVQPEERKTPAFHKIHEDAQSMSIALKDGAGRIGYKLDLAYVLSKMIHAADENPLPGYGLHLTPCFAKKYPIFNESVIFQLLTDEKFKVY